MLLQTKRSDWSGVAGVSAICVLRYCFSSGPAWTSRLSRSHWYGTNVPTSLCDENDKATHLVPPIRRANEAPSSSPDSSGNNSA